MSLGPTPRIDCEVQPVCVEQVVKIKKTRVPGNVKQAENVCSICMKSFDRLYNLKVHMRKHTGETPYHCPMENCFKRFKWRSSMAHHVRAHHNGTSEDIANAKVYSPGAIDIRGQLSDSKEPTGALRIARKDSIQKRPVKLYRKGVRKKPDTEQTKADCMPTTQPAEQEYAHDLYNTASSGGAVIDDLLARATEIGPALSEFQDQLKPIEMIQDNSSEALGNILSTAFCRDEVQLLDATLGRDLDVGVHLDPFENAMMFLAPGCDNATDADMETQANSHSDGYISTPETTAEPFLEGDIPGVQDSAGKSVDATGVFDPNVLPATLGLD